MDNFKAWWRNLAEREQRLVAGSAAFVMLGILYWGIWLPLDNAVQEQQAKLNKERQLLSWMKEKGNLIAGVADLPQADRGRSLSQIIEMTSRQKQIKLDVIKPKGKQFDLVIKEVEFETFMKWLDQLQKQYKVVVNSANLTRSDRKGYVNVRRLILEQNE